MKTLNCGGGGPRAKSRTSPDASFPTGVQRLNSALRASREKAKMTARAPEIYKENAIAPLGARSSFRGDVTQPLPGARSVCSAGLDALRFRREQEGLKAAVDFLQRLPRPFFSNVARKDSLERANAANWQTPRG